MPWSEQDYPASLKNLTAEVRHKAIEIANALLREDKYEEGRAIAIATAQAEKWGKRRDRPVRQEHVAGSTGHAIAQGDPDADHAIHVIPGPQGNGWIVCQERRRLAQGQNRADVLTKAREKARSQGQELCIHQANGELETTEDYA